MDIIQTCFTHIQRVICQGRIDTTQLNYDRENVMLLTLFKYILLMLMIKLLTASFTFILKEVIEVYIITLNNHCLS